VLTVANWIAYGLGVYGLIGLIFALWFVILGVREAPIEGKAVILRLMLMPGGLLLWPLLILGRKP